MVRRIATALCGGRGDDSLQIAGAGRGEGAPQRGGAGQAQRREHATRLPGGAKAQVSPGVARHRLQKTHRQFHVSFYCLLFYVELFFYSFTRFKFSSQSTSTEPTHRDYQNYMQGSIDELVLQDLINLIQN